MSGHHKDASVGVARVLLDAMPPVERAQVQAEAETRGVAAVEIVRRSLDILIAGSAPASKGGTPVRRAARGRG